MSESDPMPTAPIEPVFAPTESAPDSSEDLEGYLDQYRPIEWQRSPCVPSEPQYGWEWANVTTPRADGSQGQPVLLARCPWCRRTGVANIRLTSGSEDMTRAAYAWAQAELVRKHFCYAMPAMVLDWR